MNRLLRGREGPDRLEIGGAASKTGGEKSVEVGEEAKHSAGRGLKLWLLCRLSETIVMGLGGSGQGTDPGQC